MNRLNGWQRIWLVLMVMWTIIVSALGYRAGPTRIYHDTDRSEKSRFARMNASIRQRMTTPPWEGETCDGPIPLSVVEEVKDLPGLLVPVRLCFRAKGLSAEARQEIDKVVARMAAAHETEENIGLVVQELTRRASERTPDYHSTKLPRSEVERIKAEYARAYREALRERRMVHYQRMAFFWLIPGVAVYALGWSVGWIWRGFMRA
jgi:hypothetical protein